MRRMMTGRNTTPFWVGYRLSQRANRDIKKKEKNGYYDEHNEGYERLKEKVNSYKRFYLYWLTVVIAMFPVVMIFSGYDFTFNDYVPFIVSFAVMLPACIHAYNKNKQSNNY